MSKTKAIIIIVLVLVLGTVLFYFLAGGKSPTGTSILNYLPFGRPPAGSTLPSGTTSGNQSGTQGNGTEPGTGAGQGSNPLAQNTPFKLSDAPIAGFGTFTASGTPYVRYVDRATGHVNDINVATLEKTKIYNNTSPKIYVALFRPGASGFVKRELVQDSDAVLSTSVMLTPPKAPAAAGQATTTPVGSDDSLYTASNSVLVDNVGDILPQADGSLVYNTTDTGKIVSSQFAGDKPKTIFSSSFTEWRLGQFGASAILLFTKPSAAVGGYLYSLNLKSGVLQKLLGPETGLSAIASPDGRKILYERLSRNAPVLSLLNLVNNQIFEIRPTTLPEKCIWSTRSSSIVYCAAPESGLGTNAPDDWYLGLTHYSDRIWRLNTVTGTAEILVDTKELDMDPIDLINPQFSENEDYLYFINKNDLSLWAVKL